MQALEDLSIKYDHTVRTSDGQVVQFVYGDDGLNPSMMEDKHRPASLEKVFQHVSAMIKIPLLPNNIKPEALLASELEKSSRTCQDTVFETDMDVVLPPADGSVLQAMMELAEAADAQTAGEPPPRTGERISNIFQDMGHFICLLCHTKFMDVAPILVAVDNHFCIFTHLLSGGCCRLAGL